MMSCNFTTDSGLFFLHTGALCMAEISVPTFIDRLGDFDASGVDALEKIVETLRAMPPAAEIYFQWANRSLAEDADG